MHKNLKRDFPSVIRLSRPIIALAISTIGGLLLFSFACDLTIPGMVRDDASKPEMSEVGTFAAYELAYDDYFDVGGGEYSEDAEECASSENLKFWGWTPICVPKDLVALEEVIPAFEGTVEDYQCRRDAIRNSSPSFVFARSEDFTTIDLLEINDLERLYDAELMLLENPFFQNYTLLAGRDKVTQQIRVVCGTGDLWDALIQPHQDGSDWSTRVSYERGNVVRYGDGFWVAIKSHVSSLNDAPDSPHGNTTWWEPSKYVQETGECVNLGLTRMCPGQ